MTAKPAFFVEVYLTTHYGDPVPRLRWASPGPGPIARRMKLVGKYACVPLQDGGALVDAEPSFTPPKVDWPFPVSAHAKKR